MFESMQCHWFQLFLFQKNFGTSLKYVQMNLANLIAKGITVSLQKIPKEVLKITHLTLEGDLNVLWKFSQTIYVRKEIRLKRKFRKIDRSVALLRLNVERSHVSSSYRLTAESVFQLEICSELTAYDGRMFIPTSDRDHRIFAYEKVRRNIVRESTPSDCEYSSRLWKIKFYLKTARDSLSV